MTDLSSPRHSTSDIVTVPGHLPPTAVAARIVGQQDDFRHDNTTLPLAPGPDEPVAIWATSGELLPLSHAAVYYTRDGCRPDQTAASVPMAVASVDWDAQAGFLVRWRATLPPQPEGTIVRYRIAGWRREDAATAAPDRWAHDGQGLWYRHGGDAGVTTFAYRVEPSGDGMPAWARDAVIYEIVLDRFHPGAPDGAFSPDRGPQDIHGGTLRGVQQVLPYLADLGVTCLWLSPLTAAPSYHRYDPTDAYTVDPRLGTNADLRALVDAAHACDLRVMLDVVPNHVSWEHPAFVAARRDPNAATAAWFTFYEHPDHYRSFTDLDPRLPVINTADASARAHLIDAAVQWLRDYEVDAFRLDHAIGPSMDFWVAFRTATRATQPDVFTLGEATDTPDCLRRYRHRLDAVLDFPLAQALRLTFGQGAWDVGHFDAYLSAYERYMGDGPGRVSFLDNHDMDRFLFVAGEDTTRLRLAALCQFTLRPAPVVYYGTEVGLSQAQSIAEAGFGGDAEVRGDMVWDEQRWNHDLLTFYRALIGLRRAQRALRQGTRRTVHLDAEGQTYAYVRTVAERGMVSGEDVLVAFNLSSSVQTVPVSALGAVPGLILFVAAGPPPHNSGESLMLEPWSAAVLGLTPHGLHAQP